MNDVIPTSLVNDTDKKSLLTVFKKCWKFSQARRKVRKRRQSILAVQVTCDRLVLCVTHPNRLLQTRHFTIGAMGFRRKFSKGGNVDILLISCCWRCNANRRSQNSLPCLNHKENASFCCKSHKNCASLAACFFSLMLFFHTAYKTTWLTAISSHSLPADP